ncbi:hypothetical protein SK128_004127, partial [Halocaridina rubra]
MCRDWSRQDVGFIGISGNEVPCRGEGFVNIDHGSNKARVRGRKVVVDEKDFKAVLDGSRWVVTWLWLEGEEPNIKNTTADFEVPRHDLEEYEQEL